MILIISGLSDILDGIIARKFNLITDLGRILDPLADKFTQIATCYCLMSRYKTMVIFFIVLLFKETIMAILGIIVIKKKETQNSKWYGKLSTIMIFITIIIHLLYPQISYNLSLLIIIITICFMIFSLVNYLYYYYKIFYKV
jgi:cardiolipin synthase